MLVVYAALSDQNSRYEFGKRVERKGHTLSETCKGVIVGERPRETRTGQKPGQFLNPCRTRFLGLEKRTCPGKRRRLVTLT